jgi:MFS transporter, DHA3 family, macrolide efflux protein
MSTTEQKRGMSVFAIVWSGQLISIIGSNLTEFALGIWLYQHTHSAFLYGLNSLFIFIPPILVMPLAGVLADRYSRRQIMILSNIGGALTTLLLVICVTTNILQVWLVYIITLLFAISSSFLFPSYSASVQMLVPKEQIGRANGLVQFASSVARTFGPLIAGVLLLTIQIGGIVIVDGVSFLLAVGTLLAVAIPQPAVDPAQKKQSMQKDAQNGLKYIRSTPGLMELLVFFLLANIASGFFLALGTPFILSFTSTSGLSIATASAGAGLMAGSILSVIWKGPKQRIPVLMGTGALVGLSLIFVGAWSSVLSVSIAAFCMFFFIPVTNTVSMVIWQTRVPPTLMGRVMSSVRLVAWSSIPFSILVAGPLADHLFTPALQQNGALAGSLGQIIGIGAGRGIGLLLMIIGLFPIIAGIKGYLTPSLRSLDEKAPPVVQEQISDASPAL